MGDGDIVLAAPTTTSKGSGDGSKSTTLLFRVDKVFLRRRSQIFADMFAISDSQKESPQELYNGVPLVHLSDDAKDVGHLLEALYSPG